MSGNVTVGRAALALDDLLADPHGRAALAALNAYAPTWLVDQGDAAAADAYRWLEFEAPLIGGKLGRLDHAALAGWVRLGVVSTWTAWSLGQGSTCMHAPSVDRPEPVFAAAWRPGLVACARCVHLTVLRPGSPADRTCDACGHVVAGIDHGEGIYPGRLQFGPMLYAYGTCDGCRPLAEQVAA